MHRNATFREYSEHFDSLLPDQDSLLIQLCEHLFNSGFVFVDASENELEAGGWVIRDFFDQEADVLRTLVPRERYVGFIDYVKQKLSPNGDPTQKLDRFFDYFTVMPVDIDPNGIIPKIHHLVRSRDDTTRKQVKSMFSEINTLEVTKVQNLLEIVTTLQLLHKVVRHLFLTAKKQNNYPLILPLQMMLPFIMEQAEALKDAVPAFKQGQPIGDGIGPLVVGGMMLDTKKQKAEFETVYSESEFNGRKLILLKAEGPYATVGRPGEATESLVEKLKPNIIIMIDAALKLEGEDTGDVAQGFGAAIGGVGTDRFKIEAIATKHDIPVFAIVVRQSVKDAITLMKKEISDQTEKVRNQVYEMITDNSNPNETVLVIGVGNTLGVAQ